MKKHWFLLASVALAGCPEEEDANCVKCAGGGVLEVAGSWQSNFGTDEVITNDSWAYMEVVSFDNEANVALTQNPSDDEYNPDKFNRVEWTEREGDSFFYCLIAYGKDSAEEALGDPAKPDDSDPAAGGCGGFPWTELTAIEE